MRGGGRYYSRNRDTGDKINENITAREVRVISEERGQLGVMSLSNALMAAKEEGLDLVEVTKNANPPICKIISHGKHKFEKQKRDKETKKKQKIINVKEMKMRPKIDDHDYGFKLNHVKRFLEAGDKVKVTIMFRGREMAHIGLGRQVLDRVIEDLKELSTVDKPPKLEGRNMTTVLSPIK